MLVTHHAITGTLREVLCINVKVSFPLFPLC